MTNLVIARHLGENLGELPEVAQFDQVQPGHVRDPLLWLRLDSVQVECSATWWFKVLKNEIIVTKCEHEGH